MNTYLLGNCLEHGYLRGNRRVIDPTATDTKAQRRTQMDLIVDIISRCSDETDDVVQLQVSQYCASTHSLIEAAYSVLCVCVLCLLCAFLRL